MPHIHTKDGQYDHTASAMIIKYFDGEPKLLVHMHKKLFKLMQPGGHVELAENPWQAVLHEIHEETGYDISQLNIMQPEWSIRLLSGAISHPIPFCVNSHSFSDLGHFHTDSTYLFAVSEAPHDMPVDGESTDLRWVSEQEIEAFNSSDMELNVRDIALKAFELHGVWKAYPATDYDDRHP